MYENNPRNYLNIILIKPYAYDLSVGLYILLKTCLHLQYLALQHNGMVLNQQMCFSDLAGVAAVDWCQLGTALLGTQRLGALRFNGDAARRASVVI